jgi:carbonic anhydrase/acetyltransferase-like protein (isoleucine patch superfamily)
MYRGLGLIAVGVTLGWGVGALGVFPSAPAGPAAGQETPHVSASSQWAQHAPSRTVAGVAESSHVAPAPRIIRANVRTDFNPRTESPSIDSSAYVDAMASVIGNVEIGRRVYVAPFASVRGDEGQPIHIGDESNLQDGVVVHALETYSHGEPVPANTYEVQGSRYAVYVGDRVSLAHQSLVHGPAYVENDVFVGMQALVFRAHIGAGSVIEPGAKVIGVHSRSRSRPLRTGSRRSRTPTRCGTSTSRWCA